MCLLAFARAASTPGDRSLLADCRDAAGSERASGVRSRESAKTPALRETTSPMTAVPWVLTGFI